MNDPAVQIPPLRTNLTDPNGTNQTAKEWYYYWKTSGDLVNMLDGMISYGFAADRPDPANAPDGALWVTKGEGEVLYQNQGGEWHYVAGEMWATLSPDERPTDLGVNDAGFTFRTTDSDPEYAARTFVWSGTAWVETTAARFDSHETRLIEGATMENGALWVETDRSEVLYQLQGTAWHYIAGTMWDTIVPDMRPTDLGVNDAGFHYRGTDQPREFIWSGTAWVEVTAANATYDVNGGLVGSRPTLNLIAGANVTLSGVDNSTSNRVDVTIASSGGGGTGAVTSVFGRTGAVLAATGDYNAGMVTGAVSTFSTYADPGWITSLSWGKITGAPAVFSDPTTAKGDLIARGSSAPATRLGVGTDGQVLTADSTQTLGVKWGAGADAQFAQSSATIVLTTSGQPIPGCSITLNRAGLYLVTGNFYFAWINEGTSGLRGQLVAGGVVQGNDAYFLLLTNYYQAGVTQQWLYRASAAGQNVHLQALKDGGTGTSQTLIETSITALWVSP